MSEVDTVKSKVGDLVIINPNYLHEVSKIQGEFRQSHIRHVFWNSE